MRIRYRLALFLAKLSIILLKITGHRGTNFPGELAIRICPDFLARIPKPDHIYMVTGTVGKTTVTNLIGDILKSLGNEVLINAEGANINYGIATTFIRGSKRGSSLYDVAVLELDEMHSKTVLKYVTPDFLLISNIVQDSIMRHAHPEYIAGILNKHIGKNRDIKLILNADNLRSFNIAPYNERTYYSVGRMDGESDTNRDILSNVNICPVCGHPLKYDFIRDSGIGRASCTNCDFASPEADFEVSDIDFENDLMKVLINKNGKKEIYTFPIINEGLYNIYNELSAITLIISAGYSPDKVAESLQSIGITKRRFDYTEIGGRRIYKLSAKGRGSYGCSRLFEYINSDPADKEIILLINSVASMDGWAEDTCWLYDCAFEILNEESVKRIVIAGESSADYRLRLRLAGIGDDKIVELEKPIDAPDHLLYFPGDHIYSIVELDLQQLAGEIYRKIIENVSKGEAHDS